MGNTLEEVVFEIVSVLATDLPAKLDALDTEYGDGITLDDIQRFYVSDIDKSFNINQCPFVVVMGRGYSVDSSSLSTGRDMLRVEIETYVGSDPNLKLTKGGREYVFEEVLEVRIMRYARAIREVLYAKRTLNNKCEWINVDDALISNVLPVEDAFMRAHRLTCEVSTFKR
ncbi:MAG: hypothetical protein HOO67_06170 [Candidatus Peribacteraceae bacterium]|nr:hypothetical protein [Candidatus Peribacteraceae bacterium]